MLHVAPVPEAGAAPPPVRDVDGGGEGQESEPAEVVAAVPVPDPHRLQWSFKRRLSEGSRRFHNHGEGLFLVESALLRHYVKWVLTS